MSKQDAASAAADAVADLIKKIGLPTRLSELGHCRGRDRHDRAGCHDRDPHARQSAQVYGGAHRWSHQGGLLIVFEYMGHGASQEVYVEVS